MTKIVPFAVIPTPVGCVRAPPEARSVAVPVSAATEKTAPFPVTGSEPLTTSEPSFWIATPLGASIEPAERTETCPFFMASTAPALSGEKALERSAT